MNAEARAQVVLVEDSAADALVVCRLLDADVVRVDTETALIAAFEQRVDVVVSKLELPALDSWRVLEMVRARGLDVPVVVLAASADQRGAVELMRQGASDVVARSDVDGLATSIERARAHDRADGAQARLRLQAELLDAIGEGVVAGDVEGRIVYLNEAACRAGGIELSEVVGRPATTLVPPDHPFVELFGPISAADAERRSATGRIPSAAGGEVDALLERSVLTDARGEVTGFVVVAVNLTARLEAEGLAEERAQQNEAIAQISQLALQQPGVASLFAAAAEVTAETLSADLVAVWELVDEDRLLMRAGIGFPEGSVGSTSVSCTELGGLEAMRSSIHPAPPPPLPFSAELVLGADDIECGTRAAIVVDGEAFGCLEVQCRTDHGFCGGNEVNFLRTMANLLAIAVMRQRLDEQVLRAEEQERRRISDDIHDDTLQAVLAVALQVEALQQSLYDPEQRAAAARAVAAARDAGARLRTLMFDLSPDDLDAKGLEGALWRMLSQAAAELGFAFEVQSDLTAPVPSEDKVVLFRLAREAVVNAGKHAQADHVWISLATEDGGTSVTIEDDGIGLAPDALRAVESGHIGLARMRSRVSSLGGRWAIDERPGGGTRVAFWLPEREAGVRSS